MKYNFKEIGKRLKDERKKAGFKSHEALAEYLCYEKKQELFTRQRIGKWERGEELPPLEILLTLCETYKCDLGYLLCEYDCKIRSNTDISSELGLSENSIETLRSVKKYNFLTASLPVLNFVLEDEKRFLDFLDYLTIYLDNKYTIPLYFDKNGIYLDASYTVHNSNIDEDERGLAYGYLTTDNKGNTGYNIKGVDANLLEPAAMVKIQEIIGDWKRNYKEEKSFQV
ncbi:MAG: helix-turn-helix domain-containing protein [Lachnospiraceae bacterium]|nr:helix-turn-helix domain-containing protein [Lachnospiraceae bacterium]